MSYQWIGLGRLMWKTKKNKGVLRMVRIFLVNLSSGDLLRESIKQHVLYSSTTLHTIPTYANLFTGFVQANHLFYANYEKY